MEQQWGKRRYSEDWRLTGTPIADKRRLQRAMGLSMRKRVLLQKLAAKQQLASPHFFTPPQLSTSAHLSATTSHIPPFGQRHAPVVMTPSMVADVVPRIVANVPWAMGEGVPPTTDVVVPMTTPDVAFSTAAVDVVSPIALIEGLPS